MTTVHNLTPSPLRTIVLRGAFGTFSEVICAPKSSADCLDYTFDFSALLAGTGDTLASIQSVSVATAAQNGNYDLKVMWSAVAGNLLVAFFASGQPSTTQKILFGITTEQGRVHFVMAFLQITALTPATVPPGDFPADTLTNGKVLIAGIEALPSGYSANGRVVMATEEEGPVGTPSFESVEAQSYSGDGSGLNVTSDKTSQTLAEWIAALSGATDGVGIKSIEASQDDVTAGQPSKVTLTATLTDGTTSQTAFEAPAGAAGIGKTGASVETVKATQEAVSAGQASAVTLTVGLSDGSSAETTFEAPPGATGEGIPGVGLDKIEASQGAVAAGEISTVTLTVTKTNGSTVTTTFDVPPGAEGGSAELTADVINKALGYTPLPNRRKQYLYTENTPNRITVDMECGLYGDLLNSSSGWNYWFMPATAPHGWSILVYTGPKDTSIKYADNSANIINGSDIGYNKIVEVINIGTETAPLWICG